MPILYIIETYLLDEIFYLEREDRSMEDIKIIFFDVDGTLIDMNKKNL